MMATRWCMALVVVALLAAGCAAPRAADRQTLDLKTRHARLLAASEPFGDGGALVLEVAREALAEGHASGKWPDVGIEDLWAHAIKEGGGLFNNPARRWGATTARETADIMGQTTIGVWQMTVTNVKNHYGPPYGVDPSWTDQQVVDFCRERPVVQAKMIADYIQRSSEEHGTRTPYAIQRYFWLGGYVRGAIGQGAWDDSVLPRAPDGDWRNLTPEMKAATGFYAKQIVCGSRTNPHGLLYWLWVTGDEEGIRGVLRAWRDQTRLAYDGDGRLVDTGQAGEFAIRVEDLKYLERFPEAHAGVARLVEEVLGERK